MRRLVQKLNSSWIYGDGQPPRRPMTTFAWDMIDASQKKFKVCREKKAETSFRKILVGELIVPF